VNPRIFGGKPTVRGLRIKVETLLSLLRQGATPDEILTDYPDLEADDIRACLARAINLCGERDRRCSESELISEGVEKPMAYR